MLHLDYRGMGERIKKWLKCTQLNLYQNKEETNDYYSPHFYNWVHNNTWYT